MKIAIQALTKEAFAPYGRYLIAAEADPKESVMDYLADVTHVELNDPVSGIGVLYADPQAAMMTEMERHFHTEEGWIILDGPCRAAVGTPGEDPNKVTYAAFEFPAGTVVALKPGVWHFAPIPCGDKRTTVLAVLPPNTPENDIEVKTLAETMTIV